MKTRTQNLYYKTALALCVVTLPLTIQINNVCLIFLIIAWLFTGNFKEKYQRLEQTSWIWFFLTFYLLHFIGLIYSSNVSNGFFELEKKISFILFPIIIGSSIPISKTYFALLKKGFIGSCLIVMVISLFLAYYLGHSQANIPMNFDLNANRQFQFFNPNASPFWQYFSYLQVGGWIDVHPTYFSMYIIFCIAILFEELIHNKKGIILKVFFIVFFSSFLCFLASRVAIITFVLVILFYILKYFNKEKLVSVVAPSLLIVVIFFIAINPVTRFRLWQEPMNTDFNINEQTTEWSSVSLRLLEWRGSFSVIKQYWIKGVGTGSVQDALINYYSKFNTETFNKNYNSHNQYLQTFIELGMIGVVALLAVMAYTAKTAWQRNDVLYFSFIIIFCLMCTTESMLERQKGVVFFTLLHSLFLSTH
ncbi:MAG: hypothetical protein OJF59_002754 [Cytophagales bacterium]|jgi:hypothetical protein|nr:O-antigen ligase family protein [Bacteroidota bacterium]WHZ09000.1 MAG: hypothetical protein OJF59_002754 [Cytophagales bacterium]